MGAVANLPRMIWRCGCGCTSFELLTTGDVICCSCEESSVPDSRWVRKLEKPPPSIPDESDEGARRVMRLATSHAAFRSHVRDLEAMGHTGCAYTLAVGFDGRVKAWGQAFGDGEGETDRDWAEARLTDARRLLGL